MRADRFWDRRDNFGIEDLAVVHDDFELHRIGDDMVISDQVAIRADEEAEPWACA